MCDQETAASFLKCIVYYHFWDNIHYYTYTIYLLTYIINGLTLLRRVNNSLGISRETREEYLELLLSDARFKRNCRF